MTKRESEALVLLLMGMVTMLSTLPATPIITALRERLIDAGKHIRDERRTKK